MNVSLTTELEQYVQSKVDSGLYHSASEVIREGLRLLKDKDYLQEMKLNALRQDLQPAIDQADRGEFSQRTIANLKAKGHRQKSS